jgi:uncharacterized protein with PIN domain
MKFILTKELGRLAKWLRILGFDAEYDTCGPSASLLIRALKEERVILTRNRRISRTRGVKVFVVTRDFIREQVKEVLRAFKITPVAEEMFRRCNLCNQELVPVEKEEVQERVPEYVFETQEDFFTCPGCKRIYWAGTHWGNFEAILKEISSTR